MLILVFLRQRNGASFVARTATQAKSAHVQAGEKIPTMMRAGTSIASARSRTRQLIQPHLVREERKEAREAREAKEAKGERKATPRKVLALKAARQAPKP